MTNALVSAFVIGVGLWTLPSVSLAQSNEATTSPSGTTKSNVANVELSPDSGWSTTTVQTPAASSSAPATTTVALPAADPNIGIAGSGAPNPAAASPEPSISDPGPRAQQDPVASDEPPTLFDHRSAKVGGYGAIMVHYARLNDRDGVLGGVEGALLVDHRLAVGLAGYGWSNEQRLRASQNINRPFMQFGYGGLLIRYHVYIPESPVLISAAALVGGGAVGLTQDLNRQVRRENSDSFFIFEPQLGVHVNVTRWMRVGIDAGYRVTSGIGKFGFRNSDFNGVSLGGNIGFGWF